MRFRRLPLHDWHERHGAAFERVAGWQIPSCYADPVAEYGACRSTIGLSDFSHLGRVLVTGQDRYAFLDRLLTRKIRRPLPGGSVSACLLAENGTLVADVAVYECDDGLLCVLRPEGHAALVRTATEALPFGDTQIEDPSNCGTMWFLTGPAHETLLARVGSGSSAADGSCAWNVHRVRVLGYPPETQVDHLVELRFSETVGFVDALLEAGTSLGLRLIGRQAQEMLRVEAGRPLIGTDVPDGTLPCGIGFDHAIDLTKASYRGADGLRRAYREHTSRMSRLTGVRSAAPLDVGAVVRDERRAFGRVTSSVLSPTLKAGLSLVLCDEPSEYEAIVSDQGERLARVRLPVET